jgi:hypothetical protein
MEPPIDLSYLKYYDKGLVNPNGKNNGFIGTKNDNIGEMFDVYCVANDIKPLAALDFSAYGIRKFRKMDKDLINKVIEYSNNKGVKIIHKKTKGGHYLKSVFYLPKNEKNALKLMGILWNEDKYMLHPVTYQYIIGKLFGYKNKNIKFFIEKNYNNGILIDDGDWTKYKKQFNEDIETINFKLDDFKKEDKIVKLDKIKKI